MLRLRAGYDTLKYWRKTRSVAAEHAENIDRAGLHAAFLRGRPDLAALLAPVEHNGIAVVPRYWSEEKCSQARAEIDRLITEYPDVVRAFSGGSDKRMFGVESVSPLLADFHDDPFLRGFGELVGGLALYNFATLGARIDATPNNNGSGDGWHRDAHGFQWKSILYLSDVSDSNGPFEYLSGSHKAWRAVLDTTIRQLPPAPHSRYEPSAVERIVGRFGGAHCRYAGKAGTLLLVNSSGIHRGQPLQSGARYALTNYYYHPFQISLARINSFPPMMPGTVGRISSNLDLS